MLVRNPDALWTELSGHVLFMNIAKGIYFEATGIASAVWDILERPCSIGDLVAAIVARYEVDPKVCENDVRLFVDKLVAADLVLDRAQSASSADSASALRA